MLGGEAQRRAAGGAQRFRMLDKFGKPRWHFVWQGHPNVAKPGDPFDGSLGFHNGKRPYIEDVKLDRYIFRDYSPAPMAITLGPQAQLFARRTAGAVVFNPMIKQRASPNKDWGIERWRHLVASAPDLRWIQVGEGGAPRIRGVEVLHTPGFWDACGAIAGAAVVVVQEGALHHAAASVRANAIVIRGGFISPRVTGYAGQTDFYVESQAWPLGCGMRVACQHCAQAMASITPERVLAELRKQLENRKAA